MDFLDPQGNFINVRGYSTDMSGAFKGLDDRKIQFLRILMENSSKVSTPASYFDPNNPQSLGYFYVYVSYLYGLAKSMYLPDIIQPMTVLQSEYVKTGKNTFTYNITVRVKFSFIDTNGRVRMGVGNIGYRIAGHFNPLEATPENPYGMKIDSMTFRYIDLSQI